MFDVKEAIILLKQYGTPVWTSALAGVKFSAWAGIGIGAVGFLAIAIFYLFIWPKLWEKTIKDMYDKSGPLAAAGIFTFLIALIATVLLVGGIHSLVSLDYQAYKLMLFK